MALAKESSVYAARPIKSQIDNNCYGPKTSFLLLLSSNFPLETTHPTLSSVELLFHAAGINSLNIGW